MSNQRNFLAGAVIQAKQHIANEQATLNRLRSARKVAARSQAYTLDVEIMLCKSRLSACKDSLASVKREFNTIQAQLGLKAIA